MSVGKSLAGAVSILAIALAGCANVDRVGTTTQRNYSPSMLNDIAKRGGMPLVVHGAPFGERTDAFARMAADRLSNDRFGPDFTVYPQGSEVQGIDEAGNPWKTVLIVNSDTAVTNSNACTASPGSRGTSDGRVEILAALCRGDKAVTSIRGWAYDIAGPTSTRLRELLKNIALNLYPQRDEDRDGADPDMPV